LIKKPFVGEIEFKNVNFSYRIKDEKNIVFENFNLHISKNKRTLLYGDYAKGKTTIFKLLLRYYEIDSGEILIDGINIKEYEIDYLRKNIAYQALVPKLFSSSLESKNLFDNTERYEKITSSLEISGLVGKIKKLDKNINSQGLQVSDSEKQMLSIARALYFDTFIILFDFPEFCLDENQLHAVKKTLNIFALNKTIVFNGENKDTYFTIDNYIKI
jgi:ABC-type multidrug transport system fused ATPase/permease subunit